MATSWVCFNTIFTKHLFCEAEAGNCGLQVIVLQGITTMENMQHATPNKAGIVAFFLVTEKNITLYHSSFPPSLGALWVIAISGIRNKQKTGHVQFHGSKWMQELWASQVISFGLCLAVTVMEAVHPPQDNNCMRSAKTGLDDSFLFGGVMGELMSGFHWCFCSRVFLTHDRWTTL